jgi:hypothetical protein
VCVCVRARACLYMCICTLCMNRCIICILNMREKKFVFFCKCSPVETDGHFVTFCCLNHQVLLKVRHYTASQPHTPADCTFTDMRNWNLVYVCLSPVHPGTFSRIRSTKSPSFWVSQTLRSSYLKHMIAEIGTITTPTAETHWPTPTWLWSTLPSA